jgi:UDP-glucose:(heptosyl)LPS alpha-1,3-glucosyltransferase
MKADVQKIAVVIPKYGLVGGAEQFASELTEHFAADSKYDMHVFANRWEAKSSRVTFHQTPIISFPKFLTTVSFAWFARRQSRRINFSLIHSHERIFEADIFTLHGIPHRYWVHHIRRKSMSLYDLATARVENHLVYRGHCRKFVAVSRLTKEIFLQEYKIDPDRVAVIHPGVRLTNYMEKDQDNVRRAVRREFGIGPDDPAIVFASMNFEIKGLDDLIYSLARLKPQQENFKLIVAGKGNIKKYEKMARQAQIADQVIFTGVLTKDKLIRLYSAGDLYAMLSKFDTFGMVVLEAMAARLPVVISSEVGAKDLVEEGQNGFIIVNTSDHDYIASKIKILFDENVRKQMSAAAYQTACQNTWAMMARKYQDIYTDILAEKRKQDPAKPY